MSVAKQQPTNDSASENTPEVIGKGRPTPSRRNAQAANARPLVGSQDKERRKEQRRAAAESREKARLGMMAGDERYLTVRDKGPQRKYVRDYVDARWNAGELLIPVMLVFLVLSLVPGSIVQYYGIFFVWIFIVLAVLDAILVTMLLKKKLAAKFGEDNVQPGFRWYAAMRALQFRMLRAPKPQVKRGAYPN